MTLKTKKKVSQDKKAVHFAFILLSSLSERQTKQKEEKREVLKNEKPNKNVCRKSGNKTKTETPKYQT